jgi:hypothetical protein
MVPPVHVREPPLKGEGATTMRRAVSWLTGLNAVMERRWLFRKELWMPAKGACDEAWESFPELPGEHLRWYQTARGRSEIVTEDRQVLATVEGVRLFPLPGLMPRPPRRVTIGQVTYQVGGRLLNARVTTPDGLTILSFTGTKNFDGRARAVAHMSDGRSLRFPVQGTSKQNAVMAATDDAGSPVFRLRQVRNTGSGQQHKKMVSILVESGKPITPEMLLVMATGYYNLCTFFDRSAGG